jgi:type IV fimbrial biogenesis protein FimT
VSYSASGTARLVSGAFQAGTFTICPSRAGQAATVRRIIIGAPGRPRLVPGTGSDCQ